MQEIGTRFLVAVGMIWLGLNLVALGLTENGSNQRWNPAWHFMSGFLDLEWMILKGIVIASLVGLTIFIANRVTSVINEVDAEERESPRPGCNETFRSSSNAHAYAITAKPRETLEPKKEPASFYEVPISARAPETPKPTPRALTAEE